MWHLLKQAGLWLVLPLVVLGVALARLQPGAWQAQHRQGNEHIAVYSYRQWQSAGVWLEAGDRVQIRASGQWQYSPAVKPHGPEGGWIAPGYYPVPGALGGALLGRIGENGAPFFVGRRATAYAEKAGMLFFRINDDLLGDNQGKLEITLEVQPAAKDE